MADVHCKEIPQAVLNVAAQLDYFKPVIDRCIKSACDRDTVDVVNTLRQLGAISERLSNELSIAGERLEHVTIEA